jgi:PPOX class probable F420-dependent enzyme
MTEDEARGRFADARVARLATVSADGSPHLVPLCFAVEGATVWWAVDQKPKRTRSLRRLANLRAEPRVSLLADHYDEDWSLLWWVRADGVAHAVDRESDRSRALALLQGKYPQYRGAPPHGPVVAVEVERWRWWEGGG